MITNAINNNNLNLNLFNVKSENVESEESNTDRLKDLNNKSNGGTYDDTNNNIVSDNRLNESSCNSKKKDTTSIVIGKSNNISEINIQSKDKNILIKFSNENKKKLKNNDKLHNSKLKASKLRLEDANFNNLNNKKKAKHNKQALEADKKKKQIRTDSYGNQIKRKGNHKIYFKNEIDYVKIKSVKRDIKSLNENSKEDKVSCRCLCIIY